MSILRVVIVMTALTAVDAADSVVSKPDNNNASANTSAELSDFIVSKNIEVLA